jgi:hypothetical protein
MSARFEHTSCSQCGTDLGPGDAGVSSCCDHGACRVKARGAACECDRPDAISQRLDALMQRCREDHHTPTYADLLAVKGLS